MVEVPFRCGREGVDMASINRSDGVLEIWPMLQVVANLRGDWCVGGRKVDMGRIERMAREDIKYLSKVAMTELVQSMQFEI